MHFIVTTDTLPGVNGGYYIQDIKFVMYGTCIGQAMSPYLYGSVIFLALLLSIASLSVVAVPVLLESHAHTVKTFISHAVCFK